MIWMLKNRRIYIVVDDVDVAENYCIRIGGYSPKPTYFLKNDGLKMSFFLKWPTFVRGHVRFRGGTGFLR